MTYEEQKDISYHNGINIEPKRFVAIMQEEILSCTSMIALHKVVHPENKKYIIKQRRMRNYYLRMLENRLLTIHREEKVRTKK